MSARLDSFQQTAAVFGAVIMTASLVLFSGVIAPFA